MQVGDKAHDFELAASGGKTVRLSDFRGKKTVVLYFYPKDETPGCTAEACKFRDDYEDFTAAGAEVIGVSDDSVASHESFAAKHRLPFLLVSDVGGKVRQQWGVKTTFGIIKGRVTFVIDRDGIVRHRFDSQIRVGRHVDDALELVKKLEAKA
jgi:thioredoxin-dependent peroxiredoxin